MSLSLLSTIIANGSVVPIDARRLALETSSADWFKWVEWYGYIVAAGCAMEAWEVSITIKDWWLIRFRNVEFKEDKKTWAIPLAAIGLFLIVAGIVLETYCEGKVADAETELRNHFSETLTAAEEEAAAATRNAGAARVSATIAATAAGKATDSAETAVSAAGKAGLLAQDARTEADTFAHDIASAKKQAADAVSQLAAAEQRLAEATEREATAEAALSAIKTPRTLRNIPGFIAALKPFAGTEYTFSSVFSDKESIDLLIEIDKNLTEAGWKRVKPPTGFPTINVYGNDVDFSVVSSLEDGTRVTVQSQSSVESIQATPPALRPLNINAGLALNVALSEDITPPQKGANTPAHLEKGDSKVIVIMIGKKQ